jgi:hypothetical protein
MLHLPTLQPCEGLPLWLTAEDDLTEALVLWWPAGTVWVLRGTTSAPNDHTNAA